MKTKTDFPESVSRARRVQHLLGPDPHLEYTLNIFKKYFFMFSVDYMDKKPWPRRISTISILHYYST